MDSDVWSFYAQYDDWPFPARWRETRDLDPSKLGRMAIDAGQPVRLRYMQPAGRASMRMAPRPRTGKRQRALATACGVSPDVFVGVERAYLSGNGNDLITALRVAESM